MSDSTIQNGRSNQIAAASGSPKGNEAVSPLSTKLQVASVSPNLPVELHRQHGTAAAVQEVAVAHESAVPSSGKPEITEGLILRSLSEAVKPYLGKSLTGTREEDPCGKPYIIVFKIDDQQNLTLGAILLNQRLESIDLHHDQAPSLNLSELARLIYTEKYTEATDLICAFSDLLSRLGDADDESLINSDYSWEIKGKLCLALATVIDRVKSSRPDDPNAPRPSLEEVVASIKKTLTEPHQ